MDTQSIEFGLKAFDHRVLDQTTMRSLVQQKGLVLM